MNSCDVILQLYILLILSERKQGLVSKPISNRDDNLKGSSNTERLILVLMGLSSLYFAFLSNITSRLAIDLKLLYSSMGFPGLCRVIARPTFQMLGFFALIPEKFMVSEVSKRYGAQLV